MDTNRPIYDEQLRIVAEQARRFIYITQRPISRLVRDVEGIDQFEKPGGETPQSRLLRSAPPLLPASAEILDATVRVLGWRLFTAPHRLLLESMALIGPVAAAEVFTLLSGESVLDDDMKAIDEAFVSVFQRYPDVFLAETRKFLTQYSGGTRMLRHKGP